jgi:hypothetical protein
MSKQKRDPETIHEEEVVTDKITKMELEKTPDTALLMMDVSQLRMMHGENYGTSGYGLIHSTPQIPPVQHVHAASTWLSRVNEEGLDYKDHLQTGIERFKEVYADFNTFGHVVGKINTTWAIHLGKFLLGLKVVVKKADELWEPWAEVNLPMIGKRTREKFMNLAKRTDCHRYDFLGVERLDVLCSATREMFAKKEPDPIGSFMQRHGIVFDPTKEFELEAFKIQVDTAINQDRLTAGGLEVDPAIVKTLTVSGKPVNKSLVRKLTDIRDNGGSIAQYMTQLARTAGQKEAEQEEKHLKDFNHYSNRLIQAIDYVIRNEDQLERINPKSFFHLKRKLEILQRAADLNDESVGTEPSTELVAAQA